ncbi:hypothetical protein LCGC14_1461420 [marine sediment metagenome]|uniref:Uncharacterized protein n=1 Tax=marine sediment metagenome TaxID=412755 RepID=A0A0F9K124_9ZZZZ
MKPDKNNDIFHHSSVSGRIPLLKAPFKTIKHNLPGGLMTGNCTTATTSPTSPLTKQHLKKFTSIISVDFAKAESAIIGSVFGVSVYKANKMLHVFNRKFRTKLSFAWMQMTMLNFQRPMPTSDIRCSKPGDMAKEEKVMQEALGTLPFREYMKRRGVLFENGWWYFPIPKAMKCTITNNVIIDNQEYYPVADSYIEDLQYSMSWNNWSEEKFAKTVIGQCYSCMGLQIND